MNRRRLIEYLILAVVLIVVPLVVTNQYFMHILIMIGIYALLSLGLEIVLGQTGMFSLGHAAFYGLGAYTSALLVMRLNLPFWISLPLAMVVSGLFGVLLGFPVLRLRGDYLAIATLGFGELFRLAMVNFDGLTRGPMGLPGIPKPSLFGHVFSLQMYYFLIVVLVILGIATALRIFNSFLGRAFRAIKDDDDAAEYMGINTTKYKILAFAIGGVFAGAAGSFYAHYIMFISPDTFTYLDSSNMLAMVFLGGAGTIIGPILGAVLLTIIPEALRFLAEWRMLFVGLLMVLMMLFRSQGILGGNATKLPWHKMVKPDAKKSFRFRKGVK